MWRCAECNESIEPSLDVCWSCGTSRDGSRDPDFKPADDLTRLDTANLPQVDSTLQTPDAPAAPPPLPKIRFGLRILFGVVAICAIVFAIVAWYASHKTSEDYFHLGIAHLESEEYPEAIADLTRAIKLIEDEDNQSNLPVVYAARAAAHNNQGDYTNSLHDVSRAIDLMAPPLDIPGVLPMDASGNPIVVPQDTVAGWHVLRANALIGLGKKEDAIPDLKVVLQNDPKNQSALHLLAIAEGRKESDK